MRRFVIILISIFLGLIACIQLHAQGLDIPEYDSLSDNVLLRKELSGGILIHNQGMGFNFRTGRNKSFFNSRIIEVEGVSMKHPKQIRVINPYYYNARSYVYGKLNHVYILRGGYGFKKLLNRKPYWGGIELRLLYMGGLSVAFAKPVYLYFWDETYTYLKQEKYDPENYYHSSEYIYGRAPFMNGFGEIKVYPGIFGKLALNFEFGQYNSKLRALEAGTIVEFFPIPIPIMAYNPSSNLFVTFFISFQIGKRYN